MCASWPRQQCGWQLRPTIGYGLVDMTVTDLPHLREMTLTASPEHYFLPVVPTIPWRRTAIPFTILGDDRIEPDETFAIELDSAFNCVIAEQSSDTSNFAKLLLLLKMMMLVMCLTVENGTTVEGDR